MFGIIKNRPVCRALKTKTLSCYPVSQWVLLNRKSNFSIARYMSGEKKADGGEIEEKQIKLNKKMKTDNIGDVKTKSIPPSFKDAKPFIEGKGPRTTRRPSTDEQEKILASVEESVRNGDYKKSPFSVWKKFGIVLGSTILFLAGFVVYQTFQGKPAFFPLWFSKIYPLSKASGVQNIQLEKLRKATRETLLTKLSMNKQVRLMLGLPLQLGEFERFDVKIEYKNYTMEGFQVDCTKGWLHPKISRRKREIVSIPENFNGILEPMRADPEPCYDPIDEQYNNQRDYSILLEGRIRVLDSDTSKADKGTGSITFRGLIDFDHTKTIKLTNMIVSYREKGSPKITKLW